MMDSLGAPLPNWRPARRPDIARLDGRTCRVEPLNVAAHGDDLWRAFAEDADPARAAAVWAYLPYGPYPTEASHRAALHASAASLDPFFYAVRPLVDGAPGPATGVFSLLTIRPETGSIELGHIRFAPQMQRTIPATEAMALMINWAFEAGYRRFEWKCNALNAASRSAAQRLGLSFEGVFRQATVSKGRNRDTAWYAAIDGEADALASAYAQWLDPANFDADGVQRTRLSALTAPILTAAG